MWRKLFSLLVLSMMATASADCPSGQCMANDGSCMDNPIGQCRANDGSCIDNDCTPEAERGDGYCQYYWGSTSTCSNGECVNSCTNPESVLPTHSTQYTCAEVATGYTTNCGTCGDTITNTESGLEKPATLTELEKLTKVKQWICDNELGLGTTWDSVYERCHNSVEYFFNFVFQAQHNYNPYTPLDL